MEPDSSERCTVKGQATAIETSDKGYFIWTIENSFQWGSVLE